MRGRGLLIVATVISAELIGGGIGHPEAWHDDFRQPRRYERWGADIWRLGAGGASFKGGGESYLIAPGPLAPRITIEADLTITKREDGGWAVAGITLYADTQNHWRLLLVEGPQGQRYFELVERYDGEHQAQAGERSPRTRLVGTTEATIDTWTYGRLYHLHLQLTPEEIVGRVTEAEGAGHWERRFALASGTAVRAGRGGLMAGGFQGVFTRFRIEAEAPSPSPRLSLEAGPRGCIAIIPDREQTVASRLAALLRQTGYGVNIVPWEELEFSLPWERVDILLIADARRLPVSARDRLFEAFHSAGKAICLGAPALSELLGKTPDGQWLPPGAWLQAYAKTLARRPITIAPETWRRQSSHPQLEGTIVPDPQAGPTAWRITSDLQGWDTYRAEVNNVFDEQFRLLAFEARGDAQTAQLSVELTEEDGSRWIAVVDLTTDWQTYVLQASDFSYWHDSPARGRGGPGDRVQPERVRAIVFGLAASHTRRVHAGRHSYWIRELAALGGAQLPECDWRVPELAILCPSYKLYPLEDIRQLRGSPEQAVAQLGPTAWQGKAYAPVWRERGRGLHRRRPWRWLPVVEAYDSTGRKRGALVSLMIGNAVHPDALWANVAVADPAQALAPPLDHVLLNMIEAMQRGCFLLEGGAELFSYKPNEQTIVGGQAINLGRKARSLALRCVIRDGRGKICFDKQKALSLQPRGVEEASWPWRPSFSVPGGYEIETTLREENVILDRIVHRIEQLRTRPARPDEFVRVVGSRFMLGNKPWYFKGVNYWPNWIAGYVHGNPFQRTLYDPEIIERDLMQLQALGVNALSAVQALVPTDPNDPKAFRDQLDFLDRCERHGIKVFFFLPYGRPYYGGSFEKIKDYITRAGLKDHPAIMCWELAWEPIDTPWQGRMNIMLEDWNRWIIERYGSVENALADWQFRPALDEKGRVPIPDVSQCMQHGPWDRYVAAFRRAHSDLISAAYRDIVRPLREWDPKHLISFRGGACGIPHAAHFAHIHSIGAAKHMDFLNPEGYNLQPLGAAQPNDPEALRKGGLVTLYYRFVSREKPIVWMEFGYTVNGIGTEWRPELVHIAPQQLQNQAAELRHFYQMFLESGARGAAPWWWPGGFRLGENSDFGICEPDGTVRPAARVMQEYLPRFERVQHLPPTDYIPLDLEAHYPDSWPLYSEQYLELIKAGKRPYLRTVGTNTTSADCPLVAVGGGPYHGHNPLLYLNAEFNRLEIRLGEGSWRELRGGERVEAPIGTKISCRASVGNLGEAKWLAPRNKNGTPEPGRVYLAGRAEYGLQFTAPIVQDTPYLSDAEVAPFMLIEAVKAGEQPVSFEMCSAGRAYFGERRTIVIVGR